MPQKYINHSYIQSLINSIQVLTPLFCCNDMSWSTTAPTCFTHVGLRWMTVTLILWLVIFIQFVYWHLTGRAVEMQQESQGKRHSAQKRVAGNCSLVCGGDGGGQSLPLPYHILLPPVLLCPFASRLPPFIVQLPFFFSALTCFTELGLRWITVTLMFWWVVFAQFVLFVHQHLTGHAQEMQQESQGKRHSARKRVAGNYSLVNFLNMP